MFAVPEARSCCFCQECNRVVWCLRTSCRRCSTEPEAELSRQKDVILIVYEAKDKKMIFTKKNLKEMKEIFDFITLNERFPEFCWKFANTFNNTDGACLGVCRLHDVEI